jgi:hypothetical protein
MNCLRQLENTQIMDLNSNRGMDVYVHLFWGFVFLCLGIGRVRLIPHPRSPTNCKQDQENEKWPMSNKFAVEPLMMMVMI